MPQLSHCRCINIAHPDGNTATEICVAILNTLISSSLLQFRFLEFYMANNCPLIYECIELTHNQEASDNICLINCPFFLDV